MWSFTALINRESTSLHTQPKQNIMHPNSEEVELMRSTESYRIRILLVDNQSLIRQGLKAMLKLEPDLQVVGDAESGKSALEQVAALQPDVVLMDILMPEMDGLTATELIVQHYPNVKVLVLSTFDDNASIAKAMRTGARGYLLKAMPSEELANVIRFVHRGYTLLGPGLFDKLQAAADSDAITSSSSIPPKLTKLTTREQDVLRLVGIGATNREIAQQLYITEGTVKTHVSSIFNRLNLRNRA